MNQNGSAAVPNFGRGFSSTVRRCARRGARGHCTALGLLPPHARAPRRHPQRPPHRRRKRESRAVTVATAFFSILNCSLCQKNEPLLEKLTQSRILNGWQFRLDLDSLLYLEKKVCQAL